MSIIGKLADRPIPIIGR